MNSLRFNKYLLFGLLPLLIMGCENQRNVKDDDSGITLYLFLFISISVNVFLFLKLKKQKQRKELLKKDLSKQASAILNLETQNANLIQKSTKRPSQSNNNTINKATSVDENVELTVESKIENHQKPQSVETDLNIVSEEAKPENNQTNPLQVIYFETPINEDHFDFGKRHNESLEDNLYKVELNGNEGEFTINAEASLIFPFNNPDLYFKGACIELNKKTANSRSIKVIEKGVVKKVADKLIIEKPLKMEFI